MERSGSDSIWDLTGTFQAYDPVALLAALPTIRDRFLTPHMVAVEDRFGETTFHEVIGLSEAAPGVKEGAHLGEWLREALMNGLSVSGAEEGNATQPDSPRTRQSRMRQTLRQLTNLTFLENSLDEAEPLSPLIKQKTNESVHHSLRVAIGVAKFKRLASRKRRRKTGSSTTSVEILRNLLSQRYSGRENQAVKRVAAALHEL
jgi:hypothetical protein